MDAEKRNHQKELNRLRVQKHRENMHPQKRRRVNEKAREYRERKRQEKVQARLQKNSKAIQSETPHHSDCPYPNQASYKRAVRRVKSKLKARGVKLAYLCKGLLKSADREAKKKLGDLHVSFSTPEKTTTEEILAGHIEAIKSKRQRYART
jgi:hypothetical protein